MRVLKCLPPLLLSWSTVLLGKISSVASAAEVLASQEAHRITDGQTVRNASQISSSFGQKGSKVCLGWQNGFADPSLSNFKTSHVVGVYDWGVSNHTEAEQLGFDYWPMLWGAQWLTTFEKAVTEGFGTIVMGFYEPNEPTQSNMDPYTAAALWKDHIEPKRRFGYKTCSPAVSSHPDASRWMLHFMQACSDCTIDYMCLHWYGTGFAKLQAYLELYHDAFGLPILLTGFEVVGLNGGVQPSLSEVITFSRQALKYFDDTDWILAACPLGLGRDIASQGLPLTLALQNPDGTPTELGAIFINNEY
ncbi:Glycoside Hydrolase Family 128 protein [Trametes cinnabarina]|uniref:Glycoside Hydrolase Family 128 protein n=1 Tax=Pycnoporus cinnabarinus TaxID=5643 RepID=A0A060SHJ8_PYCCI|nr:Glycoside Hydrolase Family 128 protein [Trametes cinnabarina]